MLYLTKPDEIKTAIAHFTSYPTLWLDTEIANWQTRNPKLSLIQVLANSEDKKGNSVYLLDVLNKSNLTEYFIQQIMKNSAIEKVFHNANFDLRHLGGKEQGQNITCTLKISKEITRDRLGVPNLKLKTLAAELCNFKIEFNEQASDWGRRPLTSEQIQYATMDVVYLASVHRYLLEIGDREVKPLMKILDSLVSSTNFNLEEILELTPVTQSLIDEYSPILIAPAEATSSGITIEPLTISDIQLAYECPRLFYLGYPQGGEKKFICDRNLEEAKNIFHELLSPSIELFKTDSRFQQLFEPAVEKLQIDSISQQLQSLLYQTTFFPYLQNKIKTAPQKAVILQQTWQTITQLIKCWTEILILNRRYYSPQEIFARTFIAQKNDWEHSFNLPNNQQQLIRGQFNPVIYNRNEQNLLIVEHKAEQSIDLLPQQAKIALSSYIVRANLGIAINSVTYLVLPDAQESNYSWTHIEDSIRQLICDRIPQFQQWLAWTQPNPNSPPATSYQNLCQICPQQTKCKSFFPSSKPYNGSNTKSEQTEEKSSQSKIILPPSTPISSPPPIGDVTGEALVTALNAFGVKVDYLGAVVAPAFVRVKLKPNLGVRVDTIINRSKDLQVQLGLESAPAIQPQAGYVSVDIPRKDRQKVKFEQYISSQTQSPNDEFKIALGVNLDGKLVEADLGDANNCHFLVGGTTGSGKSEFLKSILLSLLVRHSPKSLKIALVDPKRVTFPEFEEIPWLYTPVVKETNDAILLMTNLIDEMEQRYKIFEQEKCPDIKTYNKKIGFPSGKNLPRIVCIFDEYADFMGEKDVRNDLETSIKKLGAKARASGIHLIVATQRPDAKVVTPLIRSNLPGRIALKTASEADSVIILGGAEKGAAKLLGKGDLLYPNGATLERLQALLIEDFSLK
jgi:S-DNA-T family DNA segregation ATPase FtsK/SpoIIIE